MSDKPTTLESFLGFERGGAPDAETVAELEPGLPVARVEQAVRKADAGYRAPISKAALVGAIGGLLNVPLMDVVLRAWNEGKPFEKYLDPERYDPDEVISITLVKHDISSTHRPRIDIVLNGQTVDSIDFELDVKLTLDGVILQVQDGNIRAVESGRIKGKATLKCENLIVFKRETEAMDLPGTLKFSTRSPTSA